MAKAEEFEIENGVLKKYHGSASYVVVPEGVREISGRAFDGRKLKGLEIPDTVQSICLTDEYLTDGLSGCAELKTLKITGESTQGVMDIYELTFLVCTKLENVTLPQAFKGKEKKIFGPLKKYIEFTYTSSNVKCKVHIPHFSSGSAKKIGYKTNKAVIKNNISGEMSVRRLNAQIKRRENRS